MNVWGKYSNIIFNSFRYKNNTYIIIKKIKKIFFNTNICAHTKSKKIDPRACHERKKQKTQ